LLKKISPKTSPLLPPNKGGKYILLTIKVKANGTINFVGELDSVRKVLTNRFGIEDTA
jgi:hypothetical protein